MLPQITITGNFPPPVNGQSLATLRLADVLDAEYTVNRLNLFPGRPGPDGEVGPWLRRLWYFIRETPRIHKQFADVSDSPLIWTSCSPTAFGHFRDLVMFLPAFPTDQSIYAAIHWGTFDRLFQNRLTRQTAQRVVDRVDTFVFLSDHLAQKSSRWIPSEKSTVIPNTIDEDVRCSDEEVAAFHEDRSSRSQLRLLYLSNMVPVKGYMDVLYAVHRLIDRGIAVRAEFVGRWDSRKLQHEFEQYVRTCHLESVVTHHGGITDRSTIKALFLQSDIFLLPTYHPTEAQPLSIIEALNAGTPVIATQRPVMKDMLQERQNALLVPQQNPDAIADAVESLLPTGTWLAYSQAARQRFIERFSPEAVCDQWLELLDQTATHRTADASGD